MSTSQLDLQFLFLEIFGDKHVGETPEIYKASSGFDAPMDELYEITTLKDISLLQGGILSSLRHILDDIEDPEFLEIISKIQTAIEDPDIRLEPEKDIIPRLMDFVYPVI